MAKYLVRLLDHLREERGQALAEYSLILAFIAAAAVLALTALGLALAGHLDALSTAFP
jgi:Flp pilus assembly pilin Flp